MALTEPVLSSSDPAWLDAVPKPLMKTLESIGLDDRFFRTLRDVPRAARQIEMLDTPNYATPMKFFATCVLALAISQALQLLPALGNGDVLTGLLKDHFVPILVAYASGMALGLLWIHAALALNAVTRDWVKVPYRDGIRRLCYAFGWGTFYFALITGVGGAAATLTGSDEAWVLLSMAFGGVVASFAAVLVARMLRAPSRVTALAWAFVTLSGLSAAGIAFIIAMAALGF